MKTIAEIIHRNDFPLKILDDHGNRIYHEYQNGEWYVWNFNSKGQIDYYSNSNGNNWDGRL